VGMLAVKIVEGSSTWGLFMESTDGVLDSWKRAAFARKEYPAIMDSMKSPMLNDPSTILTAAYHFVKLLVRLII